VGEETGAEGCTRRALCALRTAGLCMLLQVQLQLVEMTKAIKGGLHHVMYTV
jgi:hypothetical protein